MKYFYTLLLIFWMSPTFSCEPAAPNPNINKDWFTLSNFKEATLVIKGKVLKNTDESSLLNFYNQTIKNEYIIVKTLETYKGKSQSTLRVNLRPKICGYREQLKIGEERLFYLSPSTDNNFVSSIIYAGSIKFEPKDIDFLKSIISKKIKPNEVPKFK